MSDKKRLLNDLRVIDLRSELEKRNLDKSGVRGVLIQRLSKYLEEEGRDPTTFRFDLSCCEAKTPTKRTRHSETAAEPDSEDTPAMDDMVVQDDTGEDGQPDQEVHKTTPIPSAEQQTVQEEKMDVDASERLNRKRDIKDDSEATEAKKLCLDKDEDNKNENNMDADDSINLDLGDDELLNEETDSTAKLSKDDAANEDAAEATSTETTAEEEAASATDSIPADDQQVNDEAPATSNNEKADGENKDEKDKDGDAEKKDKKDDSREGGARNLWVSGLSSDTRAKDLKQLCSKHGKVIGAKVVTNARTPGSRCYGYVTMASSHDAENCIKNLHKTELHGRLISVEKAKSESESSSRRQTSRSERRSSRDHKDEAKDSEDGEPKNKEDEASGGECRRSTSRSREKSNRSDKDKFRRSSRSRERRRSPREMVSFSRIWKERDMARARERSRALREDERRRRIAEDVLRERERRQRQEKHRLELEREKLRAEREKIEREKNELLRLERERHRVEREKLELERMELKRAQLRLEEERRKRGYESGAAYRKPAASPPPEPAYDRDQRHKRVAPPPISSSRGQFEAPPPPRFDLAASYERGGIDKRDRERDYKRDYTRHVPSGNVKYQSNGTSNDDARQPMPPGTRPKEPGRSYDSRDNRPYRPSPPGKPEPRNWNPSSRYPDPAPPAKGGSGAGGGEAWTGGEPRYGSGGSGGGSGGGNGGGVGGGGSGAYEPRYPPSYQPPPPGASYPDRYAPPARDYRKY